MLAVTIPSFGAPETYELTDQPTPTVTQPTDIVIKVHAASVNPIDLKKANGVFKLAVKEEFPYQIGYDCAGTITDVGSAVTKFEAGDEVYVRLPEISRGSWAEFVKCDEAFIGLKPSSLSFEEAASMPLAAMTALQALQKYEGELKGKTVFVPAGLSGTGLFACQLAKTVFGAGKVITTVSTSKVAKVPELLGEEVVDQVIDYTKTDLSTAIPSRSVDFLFDTTGAAMQHLSLMTPKTGQIVSVSTLPSGDQLQSSGVMRRPGNPKVPIVFRLAFNVMDAISKARARRWSVRYEYMFLESDGKDLDTLREYVEEKNLKPVIGRKANFRDIAEVRSACEEVFIGKGGIGKTVISVVGG